MLVCIVIDGRNVSKFPQCGCNVSTVLTSCSQFGRDVAEILACVRNVSTVLTLRYTCGAHI